jgi:hypothetical protein
MASEKPSPSMMEKVHPKIKTRYVKNKKEKETIFKELVTIGRDIVDINFIHKQRTKPKGFHG